MATLQRSSPSSSKQDAGFRRFQVSLSRQELCYVSKLCLPSWANQPMLPTTLAIVGERCPDLHSLSICHPSNIEEILGIAFEFTFDQHDRFAELHPPLARLDIPIFAYMAELELHELHGDIIRIRAGTVQTLLHSPHLKSLSLSPNADTMFRLQEGGLQQDYFDFLVDLIKEFKEEGGQPLKLRKLVLGFGVLLW